MFEGSLSGIEVPQRVRGRWPPWIPLRTRGLRLLRGVFVQGNRLLSYGMDKCGYDGGVYDYGIASGSLTKSTIYIHHERLAALHCITLLLLWHASTGSYINGSTFPTTALTLCMYTKFYSTSWIRLEHSVTKTGGGIVSTHGTRKTQELHHGGI